MKLSGKPSDGSLRKNSSIKAGVASPTGEGASPFQPAAQQPAPPSAQPVSLKCHLTALGCS